MSEPSDELHDEAEQETKTRPTGRQSAKKSALEKLKEARDKSGVNRANIKELSDIYEEVDEQEYAARKAKRAGKESFVVDDDGEYGDEDDDIYEQEAVEKPKKGKKTSVKKSASELAADAKKRKKADAEKKSSRADILTSSAQQPSIAASFMKAAQSGSASKKKAAAADDDLDALMEVDLLDNSPAVEAPKPVAKTSKAKQTASAAKKSATKVKAELEEEDFSESKMDVSQPSEPLSQVKVDEMEANDDELAAMEEADRLAASGNASRTKTSSAPSSSLPSHLSGAVDASVMVDDSVMIVDEAEAHEYEGLDWTKISSNFGASTPSDDANAVKKGAVNLDWSSLKDDQGSLLFWWHDAYEDALHRPGVIFMFGYVWDNAKRRFKSMMVQVGGIQRTLHLLPRPGISVDEVRKEFAAIRSQWGVRDFLSKSVVKQYAFEEIGVERKAHSFLEVLIPFAAGQQFPEKEALHGKTFSHVFGATRSALETLILEANLMGPSFLVLRKPSSYSAPTSWCEYECKLEDPSQLEIAKFPSSAKNAPSAVPSAVPSTSTSSTSSMPSSNSSSITSNTSFQMPPTPKLKILSLKVQVLYDHHTKANEILAISGIERTGFDIEGATALEDIHKSTSEVSFRPFTIFRRVGGVEPPVGLEQYLKQNPYVAMENSEKSLLNRFMTKLGEFDPDVIAGHAITSFDLDVLLHRLHHFKITTWSKLGRLHRSNMPRISTNGTGGGGFGGQSSTSHFALREATSGRLLCDTYTTATEFLKSQKNYKLKTLARQHLDSKKIDISQNELLHLFSSSTDNLHTLAGHILNDAYLALQLVAKIDVLPLTKQLTELGGNLWSRSLTGARAERIEYLLMHKFFNSTATYTPSDEESAKGMEVSKIGYIIPDKFKMSKNTDGNATTTTTSNKNAPSYKGGLVLAPKSGLYEQFTLLLDFNSLYPSLIQEYNVCFTTIERSRDVVTGQWKPAEPPLSSVARGVLPTTIRELVDKRKEVKSRLATEVDATKRKQLDMRQLAIKLVANSMYGCLGFRSSRFYAMPMAELITRKGREALEKAKSIAESVSMDVIYGDTDSIMISTHTNDYSKVREMGVELKKKINKSFNELEIDIDGIFKSLLLLQKKKYAALVCTGPQRPDGTVPVERQEKGLDLVRRDWAVIASETGKKILDCIFDQDGKRAAEGVEVLEGLQAILKSVGETVKGGRRSPDEFAITKSMTKRPQDYPDASSLPHVQVALQMMKEGIPIAVGEAIQYVICINPKEKDNGIEVDGLKPSSAANTNGSSSKKSHDSIASRARSLDQVKRDNLKIDYVWYLTHQVHPSASRLCEHIEGMDASVIADCLGLDADSFKKQHASSSSRPSAFMASSAQQSLTTRFENCEKLKINCRKCHSLFEFHGLIASQFHPEQDESEGDKDKNKDMQVSSDATLSVLQTGVISDSLRDSFFQGCHCPECSSLVPEEQLKNAIALMIRKAQTQAYEAPWVCGECGKRTLLPLFRSGARCSSCFDLMRRDDSNPKQIYTQLVYLQRLVDENKAFDHWQIPPSSPAREALLRLSPLSQDLADMVNQAIKQNRFATIDCGALFSFFGSGGLTSQNGNAGINNNNGSITLSSLFGGGAAPAAPSSSNGSQGTSTINFELDEDEED